MTNKPKPAYTPRAEFLCGGSDTHYQGCACHEIRHAEEVQMLRAQRDEACCIGEEFRRQCEELEGIVARRDFRASLEEQAKKDREITALSERACAAEHERDKFWSEYKERLEENARLRDLLRECEDWFANGDDHEYTVIDLWRRVTDALQARQSTSDDSDVPTWMKK